MTPAPSPASDGDEKSNGGWLAQAKEYAQKPLYIGAGAGGVVLLALAVSYVCCCRKRTAEKDAENIGIETRMAAARSVAFQADNPMAMPGQNQSQRPTAPASAPSSRPQPASSEWTETLDPVSGHHYYFNSRTQESTWTKPPGFVSAELL